MKRLPVVHIKTTVIIVNPGKGVQARNDIRDSKMNAVPKARIRACRKHEKTREKPACKGTFG